jgi:copper chaperone for superoxide dismutase
LNRPLERRIHGLVRFIETDDEQCIIEGTVDGLLPNSPARINIHEYGDLSNGCDRYD